ncbi:MAG TPA: hypothetical protein GXX52_05060 [Synergistaceae bacterium]|nr:hypothetical protein [Synergistaceae bacterium]
MEFDLGFIEASCNSSVKTFCLLRGGANVIEYGRPIGVAASNIKTGGLVHVHNIRSLRAHERSRA